MKHIKAVVFDLDGTLLRDEGYIAPLSRLVIKELHQRKIKIIIATGRNRSLVSNIDPPEEVSTIICANGGLIYRLPDWQLLRANYIPAELVTAIIQRFRDCRYHLHAYYEESRLVYEYMNPQLGQRYAKSLLQLQREKVDYDQLDNRRFVKFITYGETEDLHPLVKPLKERFGEKIYANFSLPGVMEIMSSTVNKGNALAEHLDQEGISLEDTLAIGDGFNDLSMLEKTGVSVVMGNTHKLIRERAHERDFYLAAPNNEDGAAHFLRSWFQLG